MLWPIVGCPDRRIDRLCITCCSPSQPSHHSGAARRPWRAGTWFGTGRRSTASLAFLFAATVVFDAHEKSIEQRMLAEDVVQQLQQNAERQRFRISMQREPEAAEGVTPARMEQSSPM